MRIRKGQPFAGVYLNLSKSSESYFPPPTLPIISMEAAELELVTEEERDQIEDLRAELMDLISGHGAGSSQAQLHKDDGTLLR